ncbi:MAG: MerR family transcriptional regulator [Pseudomonadota bacterium]
MPAVKARADKSAEAFRSIGEAASELGLQTHVLRYWEGKFPQLIRPIKRPDGRRMFRPADMEAMRAVQILVHERGLTLKGAKSLLGEQGVEAVLSGDVRLTSRPPAETLEGTAPKLTENPAHALQKSVKDAFSGPSDAAEARDLDPSATKRLETVLGEITDLKRRLDAARLRKAA